MADPLDWLSTPAAIADIAASTPFDFAADRFVAANDTCGQFRQ
jgi:hypothetical protein